MGLALMYRYTSKPAGGRFDDLFALLDAAQTKEAEILGRAMRLGAMLWLSPDEEPGTMKWKAKSRELKLTLTEHARPLFGEVAEQRFNALANAMDAEATIKFR
jgi:exopolyphosphatase/guanosine-5'-triphosphate,3'-diphosphate pyrophosphatase